MTTELGNVSSTNGASVQLSDKSGQVAAQMLSDAVSVPESAVQHKDDDLKKSVTTTKQNKVDVEKQVQNLQEYSQQHGWAVNFSVEQDLNQVVIKVVDTETKSVIRQIPSEELIAIHKRIQALQQGEAGANPRLGILFDSEI